MKLFLVVALLFSIQLQAEEKEKNFSQFILGASISDSVFESKKNNEFEARAFAENRTIRPVFAYQIIPRPFIDVWGLRVLRYSLEASYMQYKVNRQLVKDKLTDVTEDNNNHNLGHEADLNTEIKGETGYITPALYLYFELIGSFHAYLGFGYGLGYSNISGDYLATEGEGLPAACKDATTLAAIKSNCERVQVDYKKTSAAQTAFVGGFWGPLGFRFARGGPSYKNNGREQSIRNDEGQIFLRYRF